jgi:hypothetical protein
VEEAQLGSAVIITPHPPQVEETSPALLPPLVRWKKPNWAGAVLAEPREVVIVARPLASVVGVKSRFAGAGGREVDYIME